MDIKTLKGMKLDDLLDVDFGQLKEDEVAYVERRLINTVNKRIKKLKEKGLISYSRLSASEKKGMSTYKPPKNRVRVTRGGKTVRVNVRNKRLKSVNKAREILLKKTSKSVGITTQEARYRQVISDTLGKDIKLDKRRLRRVNKLMKKAEEMYGLGKDNKLFSGSPKVLQTIVDIVKSRDYVTNDKAEEIIQRAIEEGYESAQRLMNQLMNEDEDGTDIDFDDFDGI